MGIRFYCPNGHKLHVKAFQAGMRGICPYCGAKVLIPLHSTRPSSKELKARRAGASGRTLPTQPQEGPVSGAERSDADSQLGETLKATAEAPEALGIVGAPMQGADLPQTGGIESQVGIPSGAGPFEELPASFEEARSSDDFLTGRVQTGFVQEDERIHGDPLAEPNVVWYVRPPAGGQYGPAAPEVVRTWLTEGRITPDSFVWREGWRDWKEAKDVFPEMLLKALPEVSIEEQLDRRLKRQTSRSLWGQFAIVAFVVAVIALLGGLVWLLVSRGGP